jgi:hypothetical protein
MKKIIAKIIHLITWQSIKRLDENRKSILTHMEEIKINQGLILMNQNWYLKQREILDNITKAEFSVFSQWGDDGIIQFLINYLDIENKSFIEFGVETYNECNTRFLLINDNWRGLIFDGSIENIETVKNDDIYWRFNLTAKCEFITKDNINELLLKNGFEGEIGLLHIDIDGNDYWVWKAINVVNPVIVIVEYNSLFGSENPWTIPYDESFVRSASHESNLYYGTSLSSLCDLGSEKGYAFIGCNSNGNNAYFVRTDKLKDLRVLNVTEGYVKSQFSESRGENGVLTFVRDHKRIDVISGLEIYNTRELKNEIIP